MIMIFPGYLVDQFIQDISNHRTDEYGGSAENRSRFALEILKAVTDAVGESKTAIRLSPWSTYQGIFPHQACREFTADLFCSIRNGYGGSYSNFHPPH